MGRRLEVVLLIDWIALDWNAEQIRMYVLIIWLASLVYFILELLSPGLDFSKIGLN